MGTLRFPPDFQLFVASRSPRRHSLLRDVGVPFTAVPTRGRESEEGESAESVVERNALAKAHGAILPEDARPGCFVLGSDTVVAVRGRIMGKPASVGEAREMLTALAGRTHKVISAVALLRLGGEGLPRGTEEVRVGSAVTEVTFARLDSGQIEAYIGSGEWRDKAGGYAVQGKAALFVKELRGEYTNVVGLPLCLLTQLFREAGFDLVRAAWLDRV